MPPSIANPVTISHTGAPSPTSTSHVGDGLNSSTNYVDNLPPNSTNHVGGTILFSPNHSHVTSPTSIHHIGDDSLSHMLVTSRSPDALDVRLNYFVGLAKEVTLLVCVRLLSRYQKHGAHPRALQILRHLWFLFTPLLP
jgi:hypothetical protein